MIKPIAASTQNFCADSHTINQKTGQYKDPLMNWPLRGAAFTNEVGEALRPLIGEYATLSWVPALMYIGADVYDKYKNNSTEYSPNSKRCLKEAVFQGMASIFLPLVAVKTGQGIFAQAGRLTKDKISFLSQEQVSKIALSFIANGKMREYQGRDAEAIKEFTNRVVDTLDFKKQHYESKNPLVKLWSKTEETLHNLMQYNKQEKIANYSEKTIRDLLDLRKKILSNDAQFESSKLYDYYVNCLKNGQTENVAIKSTLGHYQKNKMLPGKFIKTIGGFIMLGSAIKPIDNFVENVLIGKYVGPGIDSIKRNKS